MKFNTNLIAATAILGLAQTIYAQTPAPEENTALEPETDDYEAPVEDYEAPVEEPEDYEAPVEDLSTCIAGFLGGIPGMCTAYYSSNVSCSPASCLDSGIAVIEGLSATCNTILDEYLGGIDAFVFYKESMCFAEGDGTCFDALWDTLVGSDLATCDGVSDGCASAIYEATPLLEAFGEDPPEGFQDSVVELCGISADDTADAIAAWMAGEEPADDYEAPADDYEAPDEPEDEPEADAPESPASTLILSTLAVFAATLIL